MEIDIKPNLLQCFKVCKCVQSSADGLGLLGVVMAHATIIVPHILHRLQLLAHDTVCNIHNPTKVEEDAVVSLNLMVHEQEEHQLSCVGGYVAGLVDGSLGILCCVSARHLIGCGLKTIRKHSFGLLVAKPVLKNSLNH